jgi:hypothetical protein
MNAMWKKLSHDISNLPERIEIILQRFILTCSKMDVDSGVFYSLGGGFMLGACVLIYLSFNPGDPHSGWDITTDEDRFYALKKEIENETDDERAIRVEKEAARAKKKGMTVEKELEELRKTTASSSSSSSELRQRKNAKAKKKQETEAKITTTDIMEDENNRNGLTEEELKVQNFVKSLEGLSDLEVETKMEVEALKKQFGGVKNLRKIVKNKRYVDTKGGKGCIHWTLRVINWCIPLGLLIACCYALNQDYNINVLNYLAVWFPREAKIFQRMAGSSGQDVDYGVKMKVE